VIERKIILDHETRLPSASNVDTYYIDIRYSQLFCMSEKIS
jgi:hypothetical protein